jgi:hypothetical protein
MNALWVAVIAGLFSVLAFLIKQGFEDRATNIAILAEVQRLLRVLEEHKNWWERCTKEGNTAYPLIPFTTPVFDHQVDRVGEINRKVVAQVVAFHGYLQFVNRLQAERLNYKTLEFDERYLETLQRLLRDYHAGFDSAFRSFGLLASAPGKKKEEW